MTSMLIEAKRTVSPTISNRSSVAIQLAETIRTTSQVFQGCIVTEEQTHAIDQIHQWLTTLQRLQWAEAFVIEKDPSYRISPSDDLTKRVDSLCYFLLITIDLPLSIQEHLQSAEIRHEVLHKCSGSEGSLRLSGAEVLKLVLTGQIDKIDFTAHTLEQHRSCLELFITALPPGFEEEIIHLAEQFRHRILACVGKSADLTLTSFFHLLLDRLPDYLAEMGFYTDPSPPENPKVLWLELSPSKPLEILELSTCEELVIISAEPREFTYAELSALLQKAPQLRHLVLCGLILLVGSEPADYPEHHLDFLHFELSFKRSNDTQALEKLILPVAHLAIKINYPTASRTIVDISEEVETVVEDKTASKSKRRASESKLNKRQAQYDMAFSLAEEQEEVLFERLIIFLSKNPRHFVALYPKQWPLSCTPYLSQLANHVVFSPSFLPREGLFQGAFTGDSLALHSKDVHLKPPNGYIPSLHMGSSSFTNASLRSLTEQMRSHALVVKSLCLSHSQIDVNAVPLLVYLIQYMRLIRLNLRGNPLVPKQVNQSRPPPSVYLAKLYLLTAKKTSVKKCLPLPPLQGIEEDPHTYVEFITTNSPPATPAQIRTLSPTTSDPPSSCSSPVTLYAKAPPPQVPPRPHTDSHSYIPKVSIPVIRVIPPSPTPQEKKEQAQPPLPTPLAEVLAAAAFSPSLIALDISECGWDETLLKLLPHLKYLFELGIGERTMNLDDVYAIFEALKDTQIEHLHVPSDDPAVQRAVRKWNLTRTTTSHA